MSYEFEQSIFPDFPRTEHLPAFGNYVPNASSDDKVAPKEVLDTLLPRYSGDIRVRFSYLEEKIDGANCGVMYAPSLTDELGGQPFMLRNRNHILRKGYTAKTQGKAQFIPFWNWYYSNVDKFEKLNNLMGFEAAVYAEWLEKPCTIIYDKAKLPDKFIAFDIWDHEHRLFVPNAHVYLKEAGFATPPFLGELTDINSLPSLLSGTSEWAAPESMQLEAGNSKREGVYIKVCEGDKIIARYKMVRQGYKPGLSFSDNKVLKKGK